MTQSSTRRPEPGLGTGALGGAVRACFPAVLAERWLRDPHREPVWGEWLTGSLMHCDITGFTAMSERLAGLGKEGAELMAGILNRFFERMLAVAGRFGGDQVKFGGDAMLLLFEGPHHAARAAVCGLEMQRAMSLFHRVTAAGDAHRLRMRIGIHCGAFFLASVGQPEGVLHCLLLGRDVSRTAAVEAAAKPGQVVLSPEASGQLDPGARTAPAAGGLLRVREAEVTPVELPSVEARGGASAALARYMLPGLAASAGREHRRVTVVFINLLGAAHLLEAKGGGEALAQVDAYVKALLSCLEKHGGVLLGSDVAEEGDKLIALFGAPLAHEHEEASALRVAHEMNDWLRASGLDLRHRIGVAAGFAFAGEIGSAARREYTVIGDIVNLSARLMAHARPGQIVVGEKVARRAGTEFDLKKLRPLRVKGKSAPVMAYRLRGETRIPGKAGAENTPMFGRAAELASLLRLSHRAAKARGAWVCISGEAGIGKSRLAAEFADRLEARGWQRLAGACHAHTARVPFAPWLALLRALFVVPSGPAGPDEWRRVKEQIERLAPGLDVFAGPVSQLLSLPVSEQDALRSLDGQLRRQRLLETLVGVLQGAARERPLLLLIEDVHWADASSLELLSALLARRDNQIIVCMTSRAADPPGQISKSAGGLRLRLGVLPEEAARRLVSAGTTLDDRQVAAVLSRAQGNPLFIREMALAGSGSGTSLPETVNDVVLARIDMLPAPAKAVVRAASVIGPAFELGAVKALLAGRIAGVRLEEALADLEQRGFAVVQGGDPPVYAFSHVLTREAAYETLPFSERRRLHREAAGYIESSRAGQLESVCETLLHHYELAGDAIRTARYSLMSGDRAAAVFANDEAIHYYDRCLAAAGSIKAADGLRSLALEKIGDSLETAGRHKEAIARYETALVSWRQPGARRRSRVLPYPRGGAAHEAALCLKLAVSGERNHSEYDGSLRWLDEALRLLPRRPVGLGAEVCAARSVTLFRKGLYAEGIAWGKRAVDMAVRSGDHRRIAHARNMLANSYMERGALRPAVRQLRLAVRLYHEVRDFPGQASSNNNLGMCYHLQGVYDGALYYYQVALRADERVGDLVDAAVVHNNIGEVLLAQGRIEEAVAHFDDVILAQESGAGLDALVGLARVNLSRCRLVLADVAGAARQLRLGVRLLRRAGAQGLLTEALLQRAELELARGRPESARRQARTALAQAESLEMRLLQARGERLLGCAMTSEAGAGAARQHLARAVTIARSIGARHEEARAQIAFAGHLLRTRSAKTGAVRRIERARRTLAKMDAAPDLAECDRLLTQVAR